MEIILLQDIENVGDKHEIVKVKDGFGRNFLIPQKFAIIANKTNRNKLGQLQRIEQAKEDALLEVYRVIAQKLENETVKIGAKAGTTDKIFGSVTNVQLANALKEQFDVDVDRKKIILDEEVKTLGAHSAQLKLHPQVHVKLNFEVIKE
ncbi:MAG TPA: 50S ribosomal protein L9 [Saprospiraceae bacterium]|nr:50S ribosomal protein L9 [Saprospirales bacterium]HRQ28480.1 50S ribosomal protein L9 [Saprospiraceae bacterium]